MESTMQSTFNTGANVTIADTTEVLDVIREEQITPAESNAHVETKLSEDECNKEDVICNCDCRKAEEETNRISPEELEGILKEREAKLREEYDKRLEKEMLFVKDRFDFVLSNEQMRASCMLREAHRERQEKITALQTQLECKNLAGLMYVMCSERRRSKLERLRLVEEYTNYIRALQEILTEGQALILHLSRGYKTAARIDHEWREKMKKIVQEFMSFIYNYSGGTPESNQYFFDLPRLMKTEAPLADDPKEDPCDPEEEDEESVIAEAKGEKCWWDDLDGDNRPFVMFGDMADFKPDRRREVLRTVKAAKTAPRKWKEYVFNNMFVSSKCSNSDAIKDEYPERVPTSHKWVCGESPQEPSSRMPRESIAPQTQRGQSIDVRGDMGSLLKIITSTNASTNQTPKTAVLGARDSMEIQSTTRLVKKMQEKRKKEPELKEDGPDVQTSKIVLNIGKRRTSMFEEVEEEEEHDEDSKSKHDNMSEDESVSPPGSVHNDSLDVVPTPKPGTRDRIINYERECPMEKCHRMQVDSFIRSLPPYMRANPYTHFEQTFEEYETCTPEQLEILKQRIEAKKAKEAPEAAETSPLAEWTPSVHGVMTQTSDLSVDLPPCNCNLPTPDPSFGQVFNVDDLMPVKQALECISKACFFDDHIQFNRFKVIGQESSDNVNNQTKIDFKQRRYHEIRKILKHHPSLLDIFQANTRC